MNDELPEHPCYCGNGEFDHDHELQDDSFDHEYGVEQIYYYVCQECGHTRDLEASDYDPFLEFE